MFLKKGNVFLGKFLTFSNPLSPVISSKIIVRKISENLYSQVRKLNNFSEGAKKRSVVTVKHSYIESKT